MNRKAQSTLFSSARGDHATPQDFFDLLNCEFQFTLDVCADESNAKCCRWLGPNSPMGAEYFDALAPTVRWDGRCFMNPPYGRDIGKWVDEARYEALFHSGNQFVVCLLPARTDTQWWKLTREAAQIRFVTGRLRFGGAKNCAPFPSAIVVFQKKWWE